MTATLHILPTLDPKAGGVSQAVKSMIRYTAGNLLRHEVLCLDDPAAGYLKGHDFIIHALGRGKTSWNYHSGLLPWLMKNLPAYDKVIVHGLWQYQSFAVLRAFGRSRNADLYVMPHGMLDPYFQQAKGRRLKALRNVLFWSLVERHLVNSADALLFTCNVEKVRARQPFRPYRPKREEVVGLGVARPLPFQRSLEDAFKKACPRTGGKPYFLYMSRIDRKKGVDLLIRSYIELKLSEIDLPLLIIAGPGLDAEYGREIKMLAGGDPDILFPGMMSGDAKWGAFYGCEAFILPSHQENFGIAIVEALACGKPVLISNQINIYEEIEKAGAGIVEDDTFSGTLAMLKKWLLLNQIQKEDYAFNANNCYEKHYSESMAGQKMLSLLKTN